MANINNLFNLMEQRNIKAKKLSDDTGISTGNISDWKSGRSMPSADKLEILSNYFECSIDYLLGKDDKEGAYNMNDKSINDFYLIFNDALCFRIDSLCNRKNLSILDMINECNLNKGFVTYLKRLNKPLPLSTLEKICKFLKITVEDLLLGVPLCAEHSCKIVTLKNYSYIESFDNSTFARQFRQYASKLSMYERYILLEQINQSMIKSLYTESNNQQETEPQKLIAEVKRSVDTIEDDTTEKLW